MAFRRPLLNDGNNLREMTDAEISSERTRAVELYRNNPSVTLSRVNSGGNLGTQYDTRLQAGDTAKRTDRYPTEAETDEPSVVTVAYSRIHQSIASVSAPSDTNSKAFPVYYDGTDIRAMTLTDMYDTFIKDAITTVYTDLYYINNSPSLSGYSRVDVGGGEDEWGIFLDTGANTNAYTAGGIPETLDQPYTRVSFRLFRKNVTVNSSSYIPLFVNGDNDLQSYTNTSWQSLLSSAMRYAATSLSGYRIRYSVNGSGTSSGSFWDDRLNGAGNYTESTTYKDEDDYRAQEFPNGSFVRINTYTLKARLA